MKLRIELTHEEVDWAIRNYIRQSGMSIPDDGDVIQTFQNRRVESGAIYEVEME